MIRLRSAPTPPAHQRFAQPRFAQPRFAQPRLAQPRLVQQRLVQQQQGGFSLLELIIVLGIFGLVLSMAYQILLTTLDAEQQVTRMTRNGKVGQAIMTMIRRDLQSIAYHGLGREVFLGSSEEMMRSGSLAIPTGTRRSCS